MGRNRSILIITIALSFFFVFTLKAQNYLGDYAVFVSQKNGNTVVKPIEDIDSVWFSSLETTYLRKGIVFNSIVRKPILLKGKRVAFFGDSIMKGYINGYDITELNFPNLLDSIFLFTACDNFSLSSSTFIYGLKDVKTIPEQIMSCNLENYDYIIIAGGVNDWALAGDFEAFESAVSSCLDYINNTNDECKIIFITPIDCAALVYGAHPIGDLQIYRNIITKVSLEKDVYNRISIIQGNEFGFPNSDSTIEYSDLMFGDKLHPSEVGYKTLYLSGFIKVINR